jgi:beta-mannanase
MKKLIILITLLFFTLLAVFFAFKYKRVVYKVINHFNQKNTIQTNENEPVLAAFSFESPEDNRLTDNFTHVTIQLNNLYRRKFENSVPEQLPENTPVLITLETYGKKINLSGGKRPIEAIVNGDYDRIIKHLCKRWIQDRKNLYLRLNPEMEVPVSRFPWQSNYPDEYIEAFRHIGNLFREYAPNVKMVWAPAGYPGTLEYYPGDEYTDAVSLTLKSESETTLEVYPKDYSMEYELKRRLHRLRFVNKPIFVLGSNNVSPDSLNQKTIDRLTKLFTENSDIIYSKINFSRSENNRNKAPGKSIEIGFYDPNQLLIEEKQVTVEHLFADFGNLNDGTFQKRFTDVLKRGHKAIVTFEPFRIPGIDTDPNVLQNITMGKYNSELEQFFSIISDAKHEVFLRYAHEMEIPITRYPWQSQDPVDYIKSFRYFMTFLNPWPENIKKVWGPAGDRGSVEWYPGDDVVDFISIAIYGLPDKNITDPEKQESFETIFERKIWRMRLIDKPLFITEFGVKGPEKYQTEWLIKAAGVIRKNPQIVGINYFNMTDTPKAWGEIKPPDWSITKNSFLTFWEELNQ